LKTPAFIVNNSNGIGVNPAVIKIIKLYSSYNDLIFINNSSVNPEIFLKKDLANIE
tara:strand:+ start:493 stop:660 length:168 start_codon:yes stop_codon:yes gene_type:complete